MDLMWSLILVLCRPLLDDGLLQLSYFCGGILSNIMLEWSDDRKLQSYGKQYLLDKLVDISCLTLGHGCKLTNRRLWILFCNKFIFGFTFFHWFFFSKYEAKLSKFYIDSYFENQKLYCNDERTMRWFKPFYCMVDNILVRFEINWSVRTSSPFSSELVN